MRQFYYQHLLLLAFGSGLISCLSLQAQTTVFSENLGTPTGTTSISSYASGTAPATFQNKGVLTFGNGDQASPADIRNTNASGSYTGASGNGNIWFATSGTLGFSIESIDAAAYTGMSLQFGYRKEAAAALADLSVDYWNGSSWTTIANTSTALFNEAANASTGWYLSKALSLPSGAQISGLKIRFVKSGSTAIRIDDITLTGTLNSGAAARLSITSITPAAPTVNALFTITVQSRDASDNIANVAANTGISLTANNGFALAGTTTGTISAGSNTATFSNVSVTSSGTGATITATATSGDALTQGTSVSFNVLATQPSSQPTGFTTSSLSSSGLTIGWTAASGSPDGYLVLRSTNPGATYPNTDPVDGTDYTAGNTLGNATVVYAGSSLSSAVGSLNSASQYSYRIYSYNGSSGSINYLTTSPLQGQAYTLSPEPAGHAASFTATALLATSISLNFTAASTIPASGYIILRKTSAFTGADYPADGSTYTAGQSIGGATVASIFTTSSTTSVTNNVSADGSYQYLLIPFSYDGSNNATRNYYTGGSIPLASVSTPSGSSDITAVTSSEAASISSVINDASVASVTDGIQVWQFIIRDGGASMNDADALPTRITGIRLTQSAGNAMDHFSNAIQSIALFNGSTYVPATVNITSSDIQFSNMSLDVADNSSVTLSLRLSLKTKVNGTSSTGVNADGDDFGFQLSAANVTVDAPASSSQVSAFSAISSENGKNIFSVEANRLAFVQEPATVNTYTVLSPAVTVEATDAGGNRDLNYTTSVSLTATGAALQSAPVSSTPSAGLATFGSLQFTGAGTGVTLTASSGALAPANSASFDVNLGSGSYLYRSLRSGNWKEVTPGIEVWERSSDGNNWSTVTQIGDVPSESNNTISIRSGHTVTVAASCSADQVIVEEGAQITIAPDIIFTLMNGHDTDLAVYGTIQNSGTFSISTGASAAIKNGGRYVNSGTYTTSGINALFPSSGLSFYTGSTFEFAGSVSGTPQFTQSSVPVHHFTWNPVSQTSSCNFSGLVTAINGDLSVLSTGSGELRLSANSAYAMVIGGDFNQSGGTLNTSNGSTAGRSFSISIGGSYNQTGGTLNHGNATAGNELTMKFTGTGKTFTKAPAATLTATYINFLFETGSHYTLNSGITVAASRSLTVNGSLHCQTFNVNGAGSFTLGADGTLGIGDIDGIAGGTSNGNIRVSGSRSLHASASYHYNGVSAQVTGSELPGSATIIIDNTQGVTLSGNTTLTGTLALNSGVFDAAGKLSFDPTGSLVFAGGSIINYTFPSTLNNLALPPGGLTLQGNLTVTGTLDLGEGILDIADKTLVVSGDITRITGTIRSSGGSVTLNGASGNEDLFFDQSQPDTTNVLANLTINRSSSTITLQNPVTITGTVTPASGTLASEGYLTLASSVSGSARIAQIQNGADVTGNVHVQRYIVGGALSQRGWRTMSSPVQSFTYEQLIDDLLITGDGGAVNGFDAHGTNASIRYFEESSSRGWKSISATSEGLASGKGMLVFFRGDRTQLSSLTDNTVVPNNLTTDFTGVINKSTVHVPLDYYDSGVAADDGFNFVGNPYPSEINWNSVTKSAGVDITFWILNPITGNYVAQTGNTEIASGQGFFVQVNEASQSITFEESHKSSGNPTAYFKTAAAPFTVKMHLDSVRYDVAWLSFEQNASPLYVFKEDARKFRNSVYNLSFVTPDGQEVQRNVSGLLSSAANDTFVLRASSTSNSTYTLRFEELQSISAGKGIFLVDLYLNTFTDLRQNNQYTCQLNPAVPASQGDRFLLIFTNGLSLPVSFLGFTGRAEEQRNTFTLTVNNQKNIRSYELQRSGNNIDFVPVETIAAVSTGLHISYTFSDNRPLQGISYYRVRAVNTDGSSELSTSIVLERGLSKDAMITVYPNPAGDRLTVKGEGIRNLRILSAAGESLLSSGPVDVMNIDKLQRGIYLLEIQTESGIKIVKFVKK